MSSVDSERREESLGEAGSARAPRWASLPLLAVGLLQGAGYLSGVEPLSTAGALTAASPLPLAFSGARGSEALGLRFEVSLERTDGTSQTHAITPALHARLEGPFARLAAYRTAMIRAAAPAGPDERRRAESVLRHGWCADGPLARRLGEVVPVERISLRVARRASPEGDVSLEIACSE
jgi:hypothetical protein